jgi:hypothetical protein
MPSCARDRDVRGRRRRPSPPRRSSGGLAPDRSRRRRRCGRWRRARRRADSSRAPEQARVGSDEQPRRAVACELDNDAEPRIRHGARPRPAHERHGRCFRSGLGMRRSERGRVDAERSERADDRQCRSGCHDERRPAKATCLAGAERNQQSRDEERREGATGEDGIELQGREHADRRRPNEKRGRQGARGRGRERARRDARRSRRRPRRASVRVVLDVRVDEYPVEDLRRPAQAVEHLEHLMLGMCEPRSLYSHGNGEQQGTETSQPSEHQRRAAQRRTP